MTENRLFISHSTDDEAVVNRIVAYLEARGVPCWVAGRDIPPRAIYAEAITKAIQESSACGVIISKHANESAPIKRELELASHHGKPFIPIRVDDSEPGPGLDYYLRNTQWINYNREGDHALDRIANHLDSDPATTTVPLRAAPPAPPNPARNWAMPIVAAIAVAVIAIGGWFIVSNPASEQPQPPIPGPQLIELVGRWSTGEANRGVQTIEFREDGTLSNYTLGWSGTWTNEGSQYRFTFNEEPNFYYLGAISGQTYSGQVYNADGSASEYTFAFTREQQPVIGRWNTGEANRGVQSIEFRPDGTLSNYTLGWTGTWTSEGSQVRFTFNEEPNYYYLGAINGSTYSGNVYNTDGTQSEYTFTFTRE